MRMQVSAPIICIGAESSYGLAQTTFFFRLSVFVLWGVVIGLSTTVIAFGAARNIGEIYWWGGSSTILTSCFSAFWLHFAYNGIRYRHVEIRILEEKLSSIAINTNARYIKFSDRNTSSGNTENKRWSKFLDISKSLKQYRWELQIFLALQYLVYILNILYLTCLLVNSYIAAFILLALSLLVFLYSTFRFTILGVLSITTASRNYSLSNIDDYDYTDQLSTLFDFMHNINDVLFWMLFGIGCGLCISGDIISLFYLST